MALLAAWTFQVHGQNPEDHEQELFEKAMEETEDLMGMIEAAAKNLFAERLPQFEISVKEV